MKRLTVLIALVALAAAVLAVLPGCDAAPEEKAPLTFIQFYDPECPFCQKMEPIIEELRAEYEPKIEKFEIINVATEEGLAKAEEYGVFITPTFFILDQDGEIIDKISGATTKENMVDFVEYGISYVEGKDAEAPEIETEGGTQQ
ncbi:MAG: hypothetical protein Kow0067_15210 [Coriobacteriia bacterium]